MPCKEILNLVKKHKLNDIDITRLNSEAEMIDLRLAYSILKAKEEHLSFYDSLVKYVALKRFTRKMHAEKFILLEKRLKKIKLAALNKTEISKLSLELFLISDFCKDICTHMIPKSCFGYDIWNNEGASLHFTNAVVPKNPLKEEEFENRKNELRRIAEDIKANHPEIKYVFSVSWMWNIKAFQNLMPKEFNNSIKEFTDNEFYSLGHWGQFYRYDGALNYDRIKEFKETWEFPLKILLGECDVKFFLKKYGIPIAERNN